MGQTMHDLIIETLITAAIDAGDCAAAMKQDFPTPEKYRRMWQTITGKPITIAQAKQALNQSKGDK